jgi:FAD synthetase
VSLSYQGKQEDLVLLNLLLCALARLRTPLPTALQTIYVASPGAVTDVDAFVSESVAMYRLDLARYDVPANDALKGYLGERPKVKAILAGTTRTDPHGQTLTHFDETGEGLPSVTQVHPIIDWDQAEISAVRFCFPGVLGVERLILAVYSALRYTPQLALRSSKVSR